MNNLEILAQKDNEMMISEEAVLALIDSDTLEMPSWDEGCYVR